MSMNIFKISHFILIILLPILINGVNPYEYKYYFQLYSSHEENCPYLFYSQTNDKLLVINSTEGDSCTIIGRNESNVHSYKSISSITLMDKDYLVKTCMGPNKLLEVHIKNKETFFFENNNFAKITYCNSFKVINPSITLQNPDIYVILTYWTEISSTIGTERYSHKYIIFYPASKKFSKETTFKIDSQSDLNKYYPEKCTTFRYTDIFCAIHFASGKSNILQNNYIIKLEDQSVNFVISNSQLTSSNYMVPISLGKTGNHLIFGKYDIYMTELHKYEENGPGKTYLLFSYYINRISYVPYFEITNVFSLSFGLNIEDNYVHQNLFNYLVPNKEEFIILYISKEAKMSLLLTRFNISDSGNIKLNAIDKRTLPNTYIRVDICDQPKYLQSIYINSFINYSSKDKEIMKKNQNINYYKYKKDIGTMISCSGSNNNVLYQSKKIELPQCMDTLDEINGLNNHILTFTPGQNEIVLDIYGDPNLFSFRDVYINFNESILLIVLLQIQVKLEGESKFKNITINENYKKVTHIKFIKRYNYPTKKPIPLPYRLIQNVIDETNIASQLKSDICNLEISIEINGMTCDIDYCQICESNTVCQVCLTSMEGIIKDNDKNSQNYGKCICDQEKGFKIMADKKIDMCICKDNYSFYKDIDLCKPNKELENGKYIKDVEIKSGIKIYDDCYQTCKKCSKEGNSEEQNCKECIEGYKLEGVNCIKEGGTTPPSPPSTDTTIDESTIHIEINNTDICFPTSTDIIWFKLGKHIFYNAKIGDCVFIFYGNELFFVSNKQVCSNLDNYNKVYSNAYVAYCLNKTNSKDFNYKDYVNDKKVKEYNINDKGIKIDKYIEEEKLYFHLMTPNTTNNSVSAIYFSDDDEKIDLLLFKVDRKRKDTISTQVEYQFYNPIASHINEKVNIREYLRNKKLRRRLENNEYNYIYIDVPVNWEEDQLKKINELYDHNIDPFNTTSDFYLDVCYKYTTSDKNDIYLQNRKEEYYPDYPFCEDNCEFVKYKRDTGRVRCKCLPKEDTEDYDNISFKKNEKAKEFEKKFTSPNLKVMSCPGISKTLKNNPGFYITFIFTILFLLLFLYRIFIGNRKIDKQLKEFKAQLSKPIKKPEENKVPVQDEEGNLREQPEKNKENNIIGQHTEEEKKEKDGQNNENQESKKIVASNLELSDIKEEGNLKEQPNKNEENNLIEQQKQEEKKEKNEQNNEKQKSKKIVASNLELADFDDSGDNNSNNFSFEQMEGNKNESKKPVNNSKSNIVKNSNNENGQSNINTSNPLIQSEGESQNQANQAFVHNIKKNNNSSNDEENDSEGENKNENNENKNNDVENVNEKANKNAKENKKNEKNKNVGGENENDEGNKNVGGENINEEGNKNVSGENENNEGNKDEKKENKNEEKKIKGDNKKKSLAASIKNQNPLKASIMKMSHNNEKKNEKKSNDEEKNNNNNEHNINDGKIIETEQDIINSGPFNCGYDNDSQFDKSINKDINTNSFFDVSHMGKSIKKDENNDIKKESILINETNNSNNLIDQTIESNKDEKKDKKEEDDLDEINLPVNDDPIISNSSFENKNQEIKNSQSSAKDGNWIQPEKAKKNIKKKGNKEKSSKIPANPPSKPSSINIESSSEDKKEEASSENKKVKGYKKSEDLRNSENMKIKSSLNENGVDSERKKIKENDKSTEPIDDYILDKMPYNEIIQKKKNSDNNDSVVDNRSLLKMFLSVIKNNSTIYYVFFEKTKDDIFIRYSTLILCISFYICLNLFLVFDMDMVRLYTNFKFNCFNIYIYVPCLVSVPVIIIKKFMSMKVLSYRVSETIKLFEKRREKRSCKNQSITSIKHDFEVEISKYKQYFIKATYIYGFSGLAFLILNCVLVTPFCAIYPNTLSKLVVNTIVSIIGSCVLICLFYLLGVILRRFSIIKKSEIMYNISRFFNPLHLSWAELKKMTFRQEKKEKQEVENLKNNPN